MTTPTDAEIDDVTAAVLGYAALDKETNETARMIARAVLAKWGQPQAVLEPQPMPDLTQLTERGAEAWAGVDAQALREGGITKGGQHGADT